MLTLLILRHAKAEAGGGFDDRARGLTDAGSRDAAALGRHLSGLDLRPDLILVSHARRARETMEELDRELGVGADVLIEDGLYNAGEDRLRERLGRVEDGRSTVMVVGHNPGIMDLAVAFARSGDFAEIERLRGRFPPCGLAVIGFEAEGWRAACASGGRLDALVFPEDIGGG